MKNTIKSSFAIIITALSISACHRQDIGLAGGAVAGGIAGSALTGGSTVGTVAGAVGGGYLGRTLAR